MALMVLAAKRSVIARIADRLTDVQVAYSLPPEPERQCVYGGRARFVRQQPVAEHGLVFTETITVEIRVRVVEPGDDVESAERAVETIAQQVAQAVTAEPRLTGSGGSIAVTAGDTDPVAVTPPPEPMVTANLGLTVTLVLTTRGA